MPKRISKPTKKPRRDANQSAFAAIQATIARSEEPPPNLGEAPEIDRAIISAVMSALGRKGGKIGGKRSMETMTDEQRRDRATKAASARWTKKRA